MQRRPVNEQAFFTSILQYYYFLITFTDCDPFSICTVTMYVPEVSLDTSNVNFA